MRLFNNLILLIAIQTNLYYPAHSQKLPEQMRFSDDGRRLIIGNVPDRGLYDSATIRTIFLEFSQPNYWALLTQNYATKTEILAKMIVDGVVYDSVGVRFRGQTSYMMTNNSQKKSFDISTDFVRPQQKLMGYKNLNLMNGFQDPSFIKEVFFKRQIRKYIPAAKANFVQLYINGQSWGIYPSIQQQNKDFLKEWFLSNNGPHWRADRPTGTGGGGMWGDGTAALNWLSADTALYQKYYVLKSNDIEQPWEKLVRVCDVLNNSALKLETELPKVLDIDRTLWFLASEIAFADDDSYVFKGKMDYYVYYEPETGRITPIEYDGNSVMLNNASDWSPFYNETRVNYPLLNKMLKVPAWRQRYLAHLRTIIRDALNPVEGAAILENYRMQIDSLVKADPKKLYPYSHFNAEINNLKNWLTVRTQFLMNHPEVRQISPTIHQVERFNEAGVAWKNPTSGEKVWVQAKISGQQGIKKVNLYFATHLVGNFESVPMFDDGNHFDKAANDGIFGAAIPGFPALTYVRFYIEATSANSARSAAYFPEGAEHDVFIYRVDAASPLSTSVTINEIMAANTKTVADPAGEYDDWLELFNTSNQPVDFGGWFLSDNPQNLAKWQVPAGTIIAPKGYLIVWCDENKNQPGLHANFKLSASGESVFIVRPDSVSVQQVDFGPQTADLSFSRIPNGTGNFIIKAPTFGMNNETILHAHDTNMPPASISIAPNPGSGFVRVSTDATAEQTLEVWDAFGQLLTRQTFFQQTELDLTGHPAGIYFFRIGNQVRRVVLQ